MELFYAKPENVKDSRIVLDEFERRHMVQTLRKKVGDVVMVTNGKGVLFTTRVRQISPDLVVEIESREQAALPPPIALACAFIKQNRLDFILEKGTELGVSQFLLFKSHFSNYFSSNTRRPEKIVRQALKQSLRTHFPSLHIFKSLPDLLSYTKHFPIRLAAIDGTYPKLGELPINWENGPAVILIGPEGGFHSDEIKAILKHGFNGFSLGTHRLRSETAAISAVSVVSQYLQ